MAKYLIFTLLFFISSMALAVIKNSSAPISEVSYGDCVVRHNIYAREYQRGETTESYFSHNPVAFIKDECADASRIAFGFKGRRTFLDKISGEVPNNNMSGSGFVCSPGDSEEYGCIRKSRTKDMRVGKRLRYKNEDYTLSITIGRIIEPQKSDLEPEECIEYWREAKVTVSDKKSTWQIPATISGGGCP